VSMRCKSSMLRTNGRSNEGEAQSHMVNELVHLTTACRRRLTASAALPLPPRAAGC
jgi:hypothetical protein